VIADKLAVSFGAGYSGRNGFTVNDITGHDLDSRSAFFGKAQVLWTPNADWQIRGLLSGERARDGDYALNDLQALRANPFHAARDFEGYTNRDLVSPTLLVSHVGKTIDLFSTTGFVWWKTADLTDLDYTPLPLITRDNHERDLQFTQEFRVAPAKNAALALSKDVTLHWQAGLFLFTQGYTQEAVNSFAPSVLSPDLPFPITQHSPDASLDDKGVGMYGQGTLTFSSRLDVTIGVRGDHESKTAALNTFFVPAIAPANPVNADNSFNDVSPQFTVTYHVKHGNIVYGTASRGFKPAGSTPRRRRQRGLRRGAQLELRGRRQELMVRRSADGQRCCLLSALGGSAGQRAEPLRARAVLHRQRRPRHEQGRRVRGHRSADARIGRFGGVGTTDARFGSDGVSGGSTSAATRWSRAPGCTADAGVQYSRPVSGTLSAYGRADLVSYGSFQYDDANTAQQDAYSLTNLRGGVRSGKVFIEGWVRNAFNKAYVLTAFAYPGFAPSGFIGENGPARTFGIRAGVSF
jgi:iron complex outermembrane receptor protein